MGQFTLKKIISGGQTGADRAALDYALQHKIPCGGWCPLGRKAEDGIIPDHYPLSETPTEDYEERTRWNVRDSDATIILLFSHKPDKGSAFTADVCEEISRPYLIYTGDSTALKRWLADNKPDILNIAGPRESNAKGVYNKTLNLLTEILSVPSN